MTNLEDPNAVARQVMAQDDQHSHAEIGAIQHLMMCARLTEAGVRKFQQQIQLYQSRHTLNRMLLEAGDLNLIRINAINIAFRVLNEAENPPVDQPADSQRDHQQRVRDYRRYLKVLLSDFSLSSL
ncbi:hypothetical protein [Leptolyngbya iicbica]|uniref:Uncharacterized protein n=2 Tax=Cyanophyceae TaxID=3028117 RepID=A0A4Q7E8W0_9CYAN|nr:hypothetical protein [Leptolyngbya sp. LK]RZM78834.1 hypothetical protein DYY88_08560 [Leptolyngbya sp. LK]